MSGRAEKVFRFIGPLAAFGLAALLSIGGCEQGNPDPPREPGIRASPVEIDLVADLPDAWLGYGNAAQLLDEDPEQPLSQGWYPVEQQADGTRSAWSMGRRSVIEITVLQPEDRLLEIDLEPAPGEEHLPHQSVRLFWNDQELGRFPLDWSRQTLQIELPAEIQRSGINRLTFSPLYWISPLASRSALDPRPVAFRLYGVRFSDTPVGSSESGRAVAAEGTRIEQPANSMISWHYTLPSDPKLQLNLSWDLPSASKGFLFRWVLRDTRGQEHVLVERTPAGQGEESLTLDLSPYAGEMVGLVSLFSSADEGPAGAHVTLDAPRIVGTRPSPAPAPAPRRPYNVLVVLFDTLRPDYLEPHGSSPARTPSLTKFASTGFTFEQAHANASWTRPSIASLWTGLHPSAHRLAGQGNALSTSVPYLPEILAENGYRTIGVSNNAYFSANFGFDRGYAKLIPYFESRQGVLKESPSPEEQATKVWQQFLAPAFLDPEGQPTFALLHEIDPHSPYEAPASFNAPYLSDYSGNIDGWRRNLFEHLRINKAINNYGDWLTPADKEQMRALYKGEVSFVDAYFGALLQHLEKSGLRENTLVLFLSDHGEQLFDHGGWGHGLTVYEEELRIPLIFSLPGVIPGSESSSALVQGVDVLPTVLDLLGIPKPEGVAGQSLLPIIFGSPQESATSAPVYAWSNIRMMKKDVFDFNSEKQASVQVGRWKLARTTRARGSLYHSFQLFDLEADPEEEVDLWFREPVVGHTLRQLLEAKIRRDSALAAPAPRAGPLDKEVEENLRALGYVE